MNRELVCPTNVAAIRDAIREGRSKGDFLPAVYVLEPTNRCNVDCIMCPNSDFADHELGDIALDEFSRIVSAISPTAELTMLYFLGEPTVHPAFTDLLKIARGGLKGRIVVSTNATKMSSAHIDALIKNTDVILVCIDRWDRESYERIRRGSSFDEVVRTTERILAARGTGSSPLVVVKMLDINPRPGTREAWKTEVTEFQRYWTAKGAIALSGWLNTWAGQFIQLDRLRSQPTPYSSGNRVACADLWFKMVINWRGEVPMCCHNWNSSIPLGDVNTRSIEAVWQGPEVVRLRDSHAHGDYTCTSLCQSCKEWARADELDAYLRLNTDDLYVVF